MPTPVQQNVDAEVMLAIGRIGDSSGADLQARTRQATADLLSKLHSADTVYLDQAMSASYCLTMRNDSTLSDAEREKRTKAYSGELRRALYGARASQTPSADPRDVARRALNRIPVDYSVAAFFDSVDRDKTAVAKLFLEAGIDTDSTDSDGATALVKAAASGNLALVEALLQAKASVDKPSPGSALRAAARKGHITIMRILIERGASPESIGGAFIESVTSRQLEAMRFLAGLVADRRTLVSEALLAAVVQRGGDEHTAKAVQELIAMGADVSWQNDAGWTALTIAAREGYPLVVSLLTEAKADIDHRCTCQGYDAGGLTALALSATNGHESIAAMLLNAGASVETRDARGQTPLLLAINNSHSAIAKLLLSKGANPSVPDQKDYTPLMGSVGNADMVRALLAHGAKVNAVEKGNFDERNWTALMHAAARGNVDSVTALIKAGADLHARDDRGRTPLITAVRKKNTKVASALVAAGARVNDEDLDGKTALDYARELKGDSIL